MRIIVNHVTRMKTDSRICVAGINADTFEHFRPVTPRNDPLTRTLLRENGGPFGPGALVELGEVTACPNPPETEDHTFATADARREEDLTDELYLAVLMRSTIWTFRRRSALIWRRYDRASWRSEPATAGAHSRSFRW